MKTLNLEMGWLYILSAPPASGKSTFLRNNNIDESMVVSSDELREKYVGVGYGIDEQGIYNSPLHSSDGAIFNVLRQILELRLKENLTTFLDATSVKDSVRKDYVKIAKDLGVKTKVLIFDTDMETCIKQDKGRVNRVGENVISHFFESFDKESRFDFELINSKTKINFIPNKLNGINFDIIGDTHGFYSEFLEFSKELGYELKNGLLVHPEGRKMLFLGDFVDRGQKSIEMLQLVHKNCTFGGHKAIVGNHENKLINFCKNLKKGKAIVSSRSAAETAMAFAKLEKKEQDTLFNFLNDLPHYYVQDEFAFTHAGIKFFDPCSTPRSFCIYGDQKNRKDNEADSIYHKLKEVDTNKYFLIRGHNQLSDVKQTSVITLDNNIGFVGGTLNAIKLEDAMYRKRLDNNADLKDLIQRKEVFFDYNFHLNEKFALQTSFSNLIKKGLANKKIDDTGFLSLYKYSKSVFFNQSWSEDEALLKCRGLVLDLAGDIVVHPFDKVFNYCEPNHLKEETAKNVSNNDEVIVVDKLNGFLGLITKHPYKKNQLIINTQGTFENFRSSQGDELIESKYAKYVKELVQGDMYGKFLKYLNNNNVTLMFEVIHPEDKENHIVKYDKDMEGLHLIGVRENTFEGKVYTEEKMDDIGKEINCKRVVGYKKMTFGEAKKIIDVAENEGSMIRDAKTQEYLCKFKTPHYLIIKFLSRMGKTQFNKMYDNPKEFKKHINVEEEFYPLIDYFTQYVEKETFYKYSEAERKSMVRKAIEHMRNDKLEEHLTSLNNKAEDKVKKIKNNTLKK
jgi:predicted kinase